VGAESHIMGVFFQHETNTRFQFVPYRGAFQAIQDLVAGQIDLIARRDHQGVCGGSEEPFGSRSRDSDG